jgi:hypothetical protein
LIPDNNHRHEFTALQVMALPDFLADKRAPMRLEHWLVKARNPQTQYFLFVVSH